MTMHPDFAAPPCSGGTLASRERLLTAAGRLMLAARAYVVARSEVGGGKRRT